VVYNEVYPMLIPLIVVLHVDIVYQQTLQAIS
jgi:hypothetical protein